MVIILDGEPYTTTSTNHIDFSLCIVRLVKNQYSGVETQYGIDITTWVKAFRIILEIQDFEADFLPQNP